MTFRIFAMALLGAALLDATVGAADSAASPDFKEVQAVVREHLAGATDESLNRIAVEGLLLALKGRAMLITNVATEAANNAPLVARQNVYDDSVGYVRVNRVAEGLGDRVAAAITGAVGSNKLAGLVLDLRYAEGYDYAAAAAVVDLFLSKEQPLLNAGTGLVSSHAKTNAIRLPVVALVNGETSAAAEAVAAMLRQSGAGLLIGSRTAGRAGVTQDFKLSTGQTLRIVTSPVQLGDASAIPATGIQPDIEVTIKPDAEMTFFQDPYSGMSVMKPAMMGSSATNSATAERQPPKRVRVTEADLVRERRGDGNFETLTNARVSRETVNLVVQDPALARAIDLLKGLAVVRQGKF